MTPIHPPTVVTGASWCLAAHFPHSENQNILVFNKVYSQIIIRKDMIRFQETGQELDAKYMIVQSITFLFAL